MPSSSTRRQRVARYLKRGETLTYTIGETLTYTIGETLTCTIGESLTPFEVTEQGKKRCVYLDKPLRKWVLRLFLVEP